MKSNQRNQHGKAVKWISSRYSKPHKRRMAFASSRAAMVLSQSISSASIIRSLPRQPGKATALAELQLNTAKAMADIYSKVKR